MEVRGNECAELGNYIVMNTGVEANNSFRGKVPDRFYTSVLHAELKKGHIQQDDRIFVGCGGEMDRVCLFELGFTDVTIGNVDTRAGQDDLSPYRYVHEDVERLAFPDNSFDLAIVHCGLHHCFNPYRALGELCRMARKQVIVYEPYDTLLTRIGAALGYGQRYEDFAVHANQGVSGGAANTKIPNFVFRFRESEIVKFASAYFPHGKPDVRFYRALRINERRFAGHRSRIIKISFKIVYPLIKILSAMLACLNNNIAFVIRPPKDCDFHKWIRIKDGIPDINMDYLQSKYGSVP